MDVPFCPLDLFGLFGPLFRAHNKEKKNGSFFFFCGNFEVGGLYVNGDQSINESRSKVVKVDMFFRSFIFRGFFCFLFFVQMQTN